MPFKLGFGNRLFETIVYSHVELVAPSISGFNDQIISKDKLENYELVCDVTGNPPPTITWKFNGNSVDRSKSLNSTTACKFTNPGIYYITSAPNKLALCKLAYTIHQGMYECTATNEVTATSQTMNLTVQG